MTRVFLSLGSNIGDRLQYLRSALNQLDQLPETELLAVSSVYQTAAWGKTDQNDFLNIVCQLETTLDKFELLQYCQKIEKHLDRVRHEKWGPRTIDIDVLHFGREISEDSRLILPHPFMTERAFVLIPLLEIAPDLSDPVSGKAYNNWLADLKNQAIQKTLLKL